MGDEGRGSWNAHDDDYDDGDDGDDVDDGDDSGRSIGERMRMRKVTG